MNQHQIFSSDINTYRRHIILKLIFLDIDGTLTKPGENIPPDSAVNAINKARAKGNKVFLCTGRNPDM
ncbi:MAG: HAD hydrolase family protein, partial [Synergistaceae bacterium]|nr:HAD hydrolase family protein [Synergistaceae bacterium]